MFYLKNLNFEISSQLPKNCHMWYFPVQSNSFLNADKCNHWEKRLFADANLSTIFFFSFFLQLHAIHLRLWQTVVLPFLSPIELNTFYNTTCQKGRENWKQNCEAKTQYLLLLNSIHEKHEGGCRLVTFLQLKKNPILYCSRND